ncbi:MAG: RtcB family protein [Candidatus Kapabacteria bacterium]|nr:RtcB family protein [Ignavibacteriota bacterium]MCW5885437.1 RtcB family protein [Candidatus Kapabacteria bacterium]
MLKEERNLGIKPVKLWLDDADSSTLSQVANLADFPYTFHHVALMPDAHVGFGMPIGGVLALKDVIIPNAVGVDIGCGMCAVRTSSNFVSKDVLKKILGEIRKAVPVGFNHHKSAQDSKYMPSNNGVLGIDSIAAREYDAALKQVGTLGGGNHFIEIQRGDDGFIYIMIHSGSRNIGKQVADYYNNLAGKLREQNNDIPKNWQLDYLFLDSMEGQNYIREMEFCVDFAFANRNLMMERVKEIFAEETGYFEFDEMINIPHNYAALENHFGEDVWVHRKGATRAIHGEIGIIPGSQGSASYIVEGKGNPESFTSCSHGAGRTMGRNEAQKKLSVEQEAGRLDNLGIIHSIRTKKDLDEAPSAYKNIQKVMDNQTDLVDILVELKPLAVVKG